MKNKKLINRTLTTILFLFFHQFIFSQKSFHIETIAFYNLENLFDTINNPNKLDELSPIMEIKNNRSEIYKDKLSKLSSVLTQIGNKQNIAPPSIIGIVEVENKKVIQDLIKTPPMNNYNYEIIHFESEDKRGIDVALLYNPSLYKPIFNETIPAKIYKDNKKVFTRDILHSTGYFKNEKIHILVNHWPSRRGGLKRSSPLREKAAFQLKNIVRNIYKNNTKAKIIIMGDFNDNPNNKSLQKILNTTDIKNKCNDSCMYNPFLKMFKKGNYTLTYRGDFFLFDQIIFNNNFISKANKYKNFKLFKAGIYNPTFMTLQTGKYKSSPKRSFGNGIYLGGYSDHYPVYSYLIKENINN